MAKATLPTNFKDDILASSMGSKRRYNVINNSDGTISLEDVTTYTQVGSTFGAAQINATNAAANAAADASKIIDDYDTLMANTQAGYMAGALAVKEANSNLGAKLLWTNSNVSAGWSAGASISVDISKYKYIILELLTTASGTPFYIFTDTKNWYGNVCAATVISNVTYQRWIIALTSNTITLGSGAPNNNCAIPYKVYGFKGTLG